MNILSRFTAVCITVVLVVLFGGMWIIVVRYNDAERDRSVACTQEHGIYRDGGCYNQPTVQP